jgi:hypothetical protein
VEQAWQYSEWRQHLLGALEAIIVELQALLSSWQRQKATVRDRLAGLIEAINKHDREWAGLSTTLLEI